MRLTKPEVLEGAGSLQVWSGQDSGSEAAIHAVARNLVTHKQNV